MIKQSVATRLSKSVCERCPGYKFCERCLERCHLSIEGPLLWFIGLPASYVNNSVEFSMELKRTSDGMVMWKHDVKKEWSKTCGFYYDWSAEFDGYPLIIRDGLVEGMADLSKAIAEKGPESFRGTGLAIK